MTLSCINNSQYELYYQYLDYVERLVIQLNFSPYCTRNCVKGFLASRPEQHYTYRIDLDYRSVRVDIGGTFTYTDSNTGTFTLYWLLHQAVNFEIGNVEYVVINNIWYARLTPTQEFAARYPGTYDVQCSRVEEEYYNWWFGIGNSNGEPVNNGRFAIQEKVYDRYGELWIWGRGFVEQDSKLTGNAHWLVSVYLDGVFVEAVKTSTYRTDPWIPDPELVRTSFKEGLFYKTDTFSKTRNTQGVEVLPHPTLKHTKQVWHVELNEQGQEIERNINFEWSISPYSFTPYHQLTCIESQTCPPNTCTVRCDTHYCCYNSEGIAVDSFPIN